ncbi:hypothetical protein T439DRAFT_320790 [Meredithblackwellia eburnea MCA 4105]
MTIKDERDLIPPPAYDFTDGIAVQGDRKPVVPLFDPARAIQETGGEQALPNSELADGNQAGEPHQPVAGPSSSRPSVEEALRKKGRKLDAPGPPLSLHCYQHKTGIGSFDMIVYDQFKSSVRYSLRFPFKIGSAWPGIKLFRKDPVLGEEVCTISKSAFSNDLHIAMKDGKSTTLHGMGMFRRDHSFAWRNGKGAYAWAVDSLLKYNLTCYDLGTGDEIAKWRATYLAFSKDGELSISQDFRNQDDIDFIVSTGLAMGVWITHGG